ncbi:hypothetical protein Q7C36_007400 [Tachysurus vachellii]|uniref:C-type lectin domain-containing protein n=1 Tax=Tachysurus vachellii TaxID=175792 RepID=A0AA88N5E2_TACVA|nr:hypothetical protein Q7C36_007400 [Tachysurus vachellii]
MIQNTVPSHMCTQIYYLIKEGKTWSDAQAYCQATYTDLAVLKSKDNIVKLQSIAQTQRFYSSAWIGLYTNINKWQWSFENKPVVNFTHWAVTEPNNIYGNELCSFICYGKWYEAPCTWLLYFVCFDGE